MLFTAQYVLIPSMVAKVMTVLDTCSQLVIPGFSCMLEMHIFDLVTPF